MKNNVSQCKRVCKELMQKEVTLDGNYPLRLAPFCEAYCKVKPHDKCADMGYCEEEEMTRPPS